MKVYWRRLAGFPAERVEDVEVAVVEADCVPETGPRDRGWKSATINCPEDIDYVLGLCGELHRPELVADAVIIAGAIHRCLGMTPVPWDYECLWRREDFDSHNESDAELYFSAMRLAYGREVEALARKRYEE